MFKIDYPKIMYCEVINSYTKFHFENKKLLLVAKTLKGVQQLLDQNSFFRVHKSYLVNRDFIVQINEKNILLKNGESLSVSRRKKKVLQQWHLS